MSDLGEEGISVCAGIEVGKRVYDNVYLDRQEWKNQNKKETWELFGSNNRKIV